MAIDQMDKETEQYFENEGEVQEPEQEVQDGLQEEPEAQPETDTEEVASDEGEQPQKRGGDLRAALHEARQQNKELRERLTEIDRYKEETDRKLQAIARAAQARQQPQAPRDPEPNAEEDPIGHLQWQNRQLARHVAALTQRSQEGAQRSQVSQAVRRFTEMVETDEQQFSQQHADYNDAAEFVRSTWATELEEAGVPPDQIRRELTRRGGALAARAMQSRKSPAQAVYSLARRLGYAPQGEKEGTEKLAREERGQRMENKMRGRGDETDLSLSAIEKMSPEELEERLSDPKVWNTIKKATA